MSDRPEFVTVDITSPAMFVGNSVAGTAADTDIATDDHGLPRLPRHRLAARLRAAAVGVVRAEPGLLDAAEEVFGVPRRHDRERLVQIDDARCAEPIRAAVAYALHQRGHRPGMTPDGLAAVLVRSVTDAFTSLESGVEVDADGAPIPGRLRTNRVLNPGIHLVAPLRWHGEPRADHLRLLARAALATTQAGHRETRGRGRIDVRLGSASTSDEHEATLAWAGLPPREQRSPEGA
ncbi:hypothetical protein [Marinitenerispora sediminis]|uniref:CRISPR type III-associated protein domain-containing protein n=1 Tax=Marinitenerispora sediminis TaxID=1931232 RepID=A0A368T9R7_9ACTN|nr:hypothetical protein [Marinitenerispora sediminis]RCV52448.1 hypothetical protein DEF23_18925 [Marinitenerispora sediminis]RCV54971.1 hypothetical protein DEF28_06875 [Marinitenerispora sediminis]RCV61416.1 hypothetical protein DEF24_04255 [Marinitenerispora sediminis]